MKKIVLVAAMLVGLTACEPFQWQKVATYEREVEVISVNQPKDKDVVLRDARTGEKLQPMNFSEECGGFLSPELVAKVGDRYTLPVTYYVFTGNGEQAAEPEYEPMKKVVCE